MVKARARIPDRASRRRHRSHLKLRSHHRHLLKHASFASTPPPPPPSPPRQPLPTSSTTQEPLPKTLQKSPPTTTPTSLSIRRRIKFMKRSRPSPLSSSSPHSHSKSMSKSISCSSSPSLSCSSSSPPPLTFTLSPTTSKTPPFDRNVGPISPDNSPLPPLPPHPSPELLKRSVSDPVKLLSHLSGDTGFSPMKSSPSGPGSRNLMGQLPPLPRSSSSSSPSNLLRRTISDPVHLQGSTSKEDARRKMKEQAVEAEKLSGEWIVVKFICDCGKYGHYLLNAADKKYFKLI